MSLEKIEALEARLWMHGFNAGKADGIFDEDTSGAIDAFQHYHGLPVTSRFDEITVSKLKEKAL